jgi:hypothetical protein
MFSPYEVQELRLVQEGTAGSAPNAVSLDSNIVPENKLWTVLCGAYFPSAAETRTVQWAKVSKNGIRPFAISVPVAIALSTTIFFPILAAGDEFVLLPGERLKVTRDIATAGSTMSLVFQFIESDLPLYTYIEPQEVLRQTKVRSHLFSTMSRSSVGGFGSSPKTGGEGTGGGGGRGLPK